MKHKTISQRMARAGLVRGGAARRHPPGGVGGVDPFGNAQRAEQLTRAKDRIFFDSWA